MELCRKLTASVRREQVDVLTETELVARERNRLDVIAVPDDAVVALDSHVEPEPDRLDGVLEALLPRERAGADDP